MDKNKKYDDLRNFILKNFSTTTNMNDRLHTRDIIDILTRNKFLFSDGKMAEIFKSTNIGEHRRSCNISRKVQSGYYYVMYKGS